MDKKTARTVVAQKIKLLSGQEKDRQSREVCKKAVGYGIKGKNVFIYNSMSDEVDTNELINILCKDNRVYLPVVRGEGLMSLVEVTEDSGYTVGAYGIKEPIGQYVDDCEVKIDVCFTPLRAFDDKCMRVGRGKGYYDRFFAEHDCFKIALAFEQQKVEDIQSDVNDIAVDVVLTASEEFKR